MNKIENYTSFLNFNLQENNLFYSNPINNNDEIVNLDEIKEKKLLMNLKYADQLIANINNNFIIYIIDNKLFIEKILDNNPLFNIAIHSNANINLKYRKKTIVDIFIDNTLIFSLKDIFKYENKIQRIAINPEIEKFNIPIEDRRERYSHLSTLYLKNMNLFIIYDRFLHEFILRKIIFNKIYMNENIDINMLNYNKFEVINNNNKEKDELTINQVGRTPRVLKKLTLDPKIRENHIIAMFWIGKRRYIIFNQKNGIYIIRGNPKRASRYKSNLRLISGKNNFYLFGRFKHNAYKARHEYDTLYLQNENNKIGKIKRPFKNIRVLNQIGVAKIPYDRVLKLNRIHTNLLTGNNDFILHNVSLKRKGKSVKTNTIRKYIDQLMVSRNNLASNLTLTVIPFSEEYTRINRLKNFFAKIFNKPSKNKNVNLFFEKKSERAEESSIRVFDAIQNNKSIKSENYFVLSQEAPYFNELKNKYGKNLIAKYSYEHYAKIYQANYFISSELPNHLINDRLYIDSLRKKLMETPSVFLQHGIMFAKPVDNPMAFGFHKNYNLYNNISNVISSDLEAEQFYKMGYNDNDLIKTGLATFDNKTLDVGANKITYMPTYRYWEETLIYSGDITKTSYYQSIISMIEKFKEEGMLDRLLIVPHNKFSEYIYSNLPEYQFLIEPNPSDALGKSVVFITDYSSAIYDAIYRGAYPIFYWEERDYLIENYKATPPVNESNAPGPVAFNLDQLIEYVNHAINLNYELEESFKKKYKKINEFDDNNNTKRIIKKLIDKKIL